MARKATTRKKLKRGKHWYRVIAPKIFNEKNIGEILGSEDQNTIIGRKITLPVSEIIGDITKHHIKVTLKIAKAQTDIANTEIDGYELSRAFLQRLIRRRVSRVDEIVDTTLKDGKKVRLKILMITAHKTNISKRTALRKAAREEILKRVEKLSLENLVGELLLNKLQKEISKSLSKTYPLKFFDIRKIEILK